MVLEVVPEVVLKVARGVVREVVLEMVLEMVLEVVQIALVSMEEIRPCEIPSGGRILLYYYSSTRTFSQSSLAGPFVNLIDAKGLVF